MTVVVVSTPTTTLIPILSRWAGTVMMASLFTGSYVIVWRKISFSSSKTSLMKVVGECDDEGFGDEVEGSKKS